MVSTWFFEDTADAVNISRVLFNRVCLVVYIAKGLNSWLVAP